MTAPAIAPAAPATAPAPDNMDDAMNVILAETKAQHASDTAPPAERPRDASGKFLPVNAGESGEAVVPAGSEAPTVPVEGAPVPAEGAPTETPDGADTDTPAEIPEGYVAVDELPEDRARAFKVFDAEGEIVPPNLTFKLTANGKERELSTDKLVAYAQMGVYNHEREQAMQATQQQSQQVAQRLQATEQQVAERDRQIEALLSDPEYLLRAQAAYEQMNTPEARAERQRQEFEQQRQAFQLQQVQAQTTQFLDTEVAPALEQIVSALPEVSREELAARLYLGLDRYRQNGLLMPAGYDAARQLIVNDLVPFAQQLHEHRAAGKTPPKQVLEAVTDKAKADVQAAQVRAQKARSAATRGLRPGGRAQPEAAPEPVVRNFKDAEAAVIGRTIAAVRGG